MLGSRSQAASMPWQGAVEEHSIWQKQF